MHGVTLRQRATLIDPFSASCPDGRTDLSPPVLSSNIASLAEQGDALGGCMEGLLLYLNRAIRNDQPWEQ